MLRTSSCMSGLVPAQRQSQGLRWASAGRPIARPLLRCRATWRPNEELVELLDEKPELKHVAASVLAASVVLGPAFAAEASTTLVEAQLAQAPEMVSIMQERTGQSMSQQSESQTAQQQRADVIQKMAGPRSAAITSLRAQIDRLTSRLEREEASRQEQAQEISRLEAQLAERRAAEGGMDSPETARIEAQLRKQKELEAEVQRTKKAEVDLKNQKEEIKRLQAKLRDQEELESKLALSMERQAERSARLRNQLLAQEEIQQQLKRQREVEQRLKDSLQIEAVERQRAQAAAIAAAKAMAQKQADEAAAAAAQAAQVAQAAAQAPAATVAAAPTPAPLPKEDTLSPLAVLMQRANEVAAQYDDEPAAPAAAPAPAAPRAAAPVVKDELTAAADFVTSLAPYEEEVEEEEEVQPFQMAAPVAPPAPVVAAAPAPAAAAAVPAPSTTSTNDGMDYQRLVTNAGLLVGGTLAVYAALLQVNKKDADAQSDQKELMVQLNQERQTVQQAKSQAAQVAATLANEQELVIKLKRQLEELTGGGKRLSAAEARERDAAFKADTLTSKALDKERKLADAIRAEAKAAAEAVEAERTAKFVAQAEQRAAAEKLKAAEVALAEEKELARQFNEEVQRLRSVLENNGAGGVADSMKKSLDAKIKESAEAKATVQKLTKELAEAAKKAAAQEKSLAKISKESVDLQDAMVSLKAQTSDMIAEAHAEADKAMAVREELEVQLAVAVAAVEEEQQKALAARSEILKIRAEIDKSREELKKTQKGLEEAQATNKRLTSQVSELQSKLKVAEKSLASGGSSDEVAALRKDLTAANNQLLVSAKALEAERGEKEVLVLELEKAKAALGSAMDGDDNLVGVLQQEAEDLRLQIASLQTNALEMRAQMSEMNEAFLRRLSNAANDADAAKVAKSAAEAKNAALAAELEQATQLVVYLEAANAKEANAIESLNRELQATKAQLAMLQGGASGRDSGARELMAQLKAAQTRLAEAEAEKTRALASRQEVAAASRREVEALRAELMKAEAEAMRASADLFEERRARQLAEAATSQGGRGGFDSGRGRRPDTEEAIPAGARVGAARGRRVGRD